MTDILLLIISVVQTWAKTVEIVEMCKHLKCENFSNVSVCGIRHEGTVVRFKLFENECALLKYGCAVNDSDVYGLISMEYCSRVLTRKVNIGEVVAHETESIEDLLAKNAYNIQNRQRNRKYSDNNQTDAINDKCKDDCSLLIKKEICGIRPDGEGYKVRLFDNGCQLNKYNCDTKPNFIRTDMFICNATFGTPENMTNIVKKTSRAPHIMTSFSSSTIEATNGSIDPKLKNLIVIDSSMLGKTNDVNETISNFFAATHVLDLPMKQLDENELKTRRMRVKIFKPVKVFQPWIVVPKKIKADYFHMPTLSTCYHKCPTKCPDTYAPVCGVPGIKAWEPSIMFQNHCYMDIAQCKMFWENKSQTAMTSSYIEASFLFCLGDQLNGLYRFLPLIRTLQRMGRLKKKGRFRYKLRHMKFLNELVIKEPKLMG